MTRHMVLIGVLAMFFPSFSVADDQLEMVYRCESPSGITLYTNKERPGCEVMSLPALTIAPAQGAVPRSSNAIPYGLRPLPSDWFDYGGSVGSLRNRLTQGGFTVSKTGLITMRR